MAVLALDVLVGGVLDHVPTGRRSERVAFLTDGVAPVTEFLRATGAVERGEGIRMIRVFPLALQTHVTVATGSLFGTGVEVTEEPALGFRRIIEKFPVAEYRFGT